MLLTFLSKNWIQKARKGLSNTDSPPFDKINRHIVTVINPGEN